MIGGLSLSACAHGFEEFKLFKNNQTSTEKIEFLPFSVPKMILLLAAYY